MATSAFEADPRSGHSVGDGPGDEDLPASGEYSDPCSDMNSYRREIIGPPISRSPERTPARDSRPISWTAAVAAPAHRIAFAGLSKEARIPSPVCLIWGPLKSSRKDSFRSWEGLTGTPKRDSGLGCVLLDMGQIVRFESFPQR